jgi:DNA-binding Lrp family transcriptional regulator
VSAVDDRDRALLAALEDGLPLVARPYRAIGEALGLSEADVIARLRRLSDGGVLSRFGVVVRHRALGYTANAMVVWDIPDHRVDHAGHALARYPFVTLCYRRPRREGWPYNLFCMIHGRAEEIVLLQVAELRAALRPDVRGHAVLFSTRAFKQHGARYGRPPLLELSR